MAPWYLLRQEDYIYDLDWVAPQDALFIDVLMDQYAIGNFNPLRVNAHAVLIARDVVNKEFKKDFTFEYCMGRLQLLKKRYRVMYWVTRKHGVRYDPDTNRVTASDVVWDEIFQTNEFGIAYQEFGDPKWLELIALFGSLEDHVPLPHTEVIEISSDNETNDIGNMQGLPNSNASPPSVVNISSSWDVADQSFWNYLGQFGHSFDSASEGSVNQPLPPEHGKCTPGPSAQPSPVRYPRPPPRYMPSPSKSVDSKGSSCKPA
ncbi:hypothetical protein DH2020_020826 [Rehmannia glutinosa]|uniref:Myb/SANT-like domain-containing protein n=1 Tax=Rehmannia glutinosa TaxID=99300 RepID=A0ABR0W8N5_REHGL